MTGVGEFHLNFFGLPIEAVPNPETGFTEDQVKTKSLSRNSIHLLSFTRNLTFQIHSYLLFFFLEHV